MSPLTKRSRRSRGPYTGDRILTAASPLLTKDLQGFLLSCLSLWDQDYTEQEKHILIGSLPRAFRSYQPNQDGNLTCPFTMESAYSNFYLNAGRSKFLEDIGAGHYEKRWQNKARRAMQERKRGDFADHLHRRAEAMFGEASNGNATANQGLAHSQVKSEARHS